MAGASLKNYQGLYWLSFWLSMAALGVGRAWDSYWHATQPFDNFWSPPHLFAYGATVASFLLANALLRRRASPPGFREALGLIIAAQFVVIVAGSLLDFGWHTWFGLNETSWSFPHALLIWAWLVVLLGYIAGFVSLHREANLPAYASPLLGVLLLGFSAAPLLGPFYHNLSPQTTQAVAALPVLIENTEAQEVFNIYLSKNLDRTHGLAIVLGGFWAGLVLSFLWRLDARSKIFLTVALLWSLIAAAGDWNSVRWLELNGMNPDSSLSWLPPPILPAALAYILLRPLQGMPQLRWFCVGAVYGWISFNLFYPAPPTNSLVLILSAAAVMTGATAILGARLGDDVAAAVDQLKTHQVRRFLGVAIGISLALGFLDLYLRWKV